VKPAITFVRRDCVRRDPVTTTFSAPCDSIPLAELDTRFALVFEAVVAGVAITGLDAVATGTVVVAEVFFFLCLWEA